MVLVLSGVYLGVLKERHRRILYFIGKT